MFPGEACSRNPERGPLWTRWTNHPGGPCSPGTGCPRMIGVNSKHPQVSVKRAVRKKKKKTSRTHAPSMKRLKQAFLPCRKPFLIYCYSKKVHPEETSRSFIGLKLPPVLIIVQMESVTLYMPLVDDSTHPFPGGRCLVVHTYE